MESETEREVFTLSVQSQRQVLAWMLKDHAFLLRCSELGVTHHDLAVDAVLADLTKTVFEIVKEYGHCSAQELRARLSSNYLVAADARPRQKLLDEIMSEPEIDLNLLKNELAIQIKAIHYKKYISESVKFHNKKRFDQANALLQEYLEKIIRISFEEIPTTFQGWVEEANPLPRTYKFYKYWQSFFGYVAETREFLKDDEWAAIKIHAGDFTKAPYDFKPSNSLLLVRDEFIRRRVHNQKPDEE